MRTLVLAAATALGVGCIANPVSPTPQQQEVLLQLYSSRANPPPLRNGASPAPSLPDGARAPGDCGTGHSMETDAPTEETCLPNPSGSDRGVGAEPIILP